MPQGPQRKSDEEAVLTRRMSIAIGSALGLTIVILWAAAPPSANTLLRWMAVETAEPRVRVVADSWSWQVHYAPERPGDPSVTHHELRLPAGARHEVTLVTRDYLHTLSVPGLLEPQDIIPGMRSRMELHAARPGIYRGACVSFCGPPHVEMALRVIIEPRDAFEDWLRQERSRRRQAHEVTAQAADR